MIAHGRILRQSAYSNACFNPDGHARLPTPWCGQLYAAQRRVIVIAMPRRSPYSSLPVSAEQRAALEQLIQVGQGGGQQAEKMAQRAKAILLAAQGHAIKDIGWRAGMGKSATFRWLSRFARLGLAGLHDKVGIKTLVITGEQRLELMRLADGDPSLGSAAREISRRAKVILLASEGRSGRQIARQLDMATASVVNWRTDFIRLGIPGLMPPRTSRASSVTPEQRSALEQLVNAATDGNKNASQVALRAQAMLLAADGAPNDRIANQIGATSDQVSLWRQRFSRNGVPGIMWEPIPATLPLVVSAGQRQSLLQLVDAGDFGGKRDQVIALRAKIILLAAKGMTNAGICAELGVGKDAVRIGRARFKEWGIPGVTQEQPAQALVLNSQERSALKALIMVGQHGDENARETALRARTILLADDGMDCAKVGRKLGIDGGRVQRWRKRFSRLRMACFDRGQMTFTPPSLSIAQRAELRRLARLAARPDKRSRLTGRAARTILLAAQGVPNQVIAERVDMHVYTVRHWRKAFANLGLPGIISKRPTPRLPLNAEQRVALEKLAGAAGAGDINARESARRAKAVLLAAAGKSADEIARILGATLHEVHLWRRRFGRLGIPGLRIRPKTPPVTARQRAALEKLAGGGRGCKNQRLAQRARAILLTAQGKTIPEIARHLQVNDHSVWEWRIRFAQSGLRGLRPKTVSPLVVKARERVALKRLAGVPARGDVNAERTALRAKAILLTAQGHSAREIAHQLGATIKQIHTWRYRFTHAGISSILPGSHPASSLTARDGPGLKPVGPRITAP